jgi:hypothetical protein
MPDQSISHRVRSMHVAAGVAIGTSAVAVGNRDIERLEAESAPVYVPISRGRSALKPERSACPATLRKRTRRRTF